MTPQKRTICEFYLENNFNSCLSANTPTLAHSFIVKIERKLKFIDVDLRQSCSAANKGRSTVNYRQSLAFDRPFYHIMIIMTGGFSMKSKQALLEILQYSLQNIYAEASF